MLPSATDPSEPYETEPLPGDAAIVPPVQPLTKAPEGFETTRPVGRLAPKERLEAEVKDPELSIVNVRVEPAEPATISTGFKMAEKPGGASSTFSWAVAVPLFPLLEFKAVVVTEKGDPSVVTAVLVTSTVTVQLEPSAAEPPENETLLPLSTAETDPPTQVVAPFAGVARKRSAGRDAEKASAVASVVEALLSIVQTSCPVSPSTIVSGLNRALKSGGASITVRLFDDAGPLSPLLEERRLLVTEKEPAELLVT